jgi:hypothetical protein
MPQTTFLPNETFEEARQRMLAETARFIEWGLAHPELMLRIPRHAVGKGDFSEGVKRAFWGIAWSRRDLPG